MAFDVLFVCTGNICRSPTAERLMLARLAGSTGHAELRIHSAGTRAVVGRGMDEASALVLRELGGDSVGHVATQLELDHVDRADLILTAGTQHRSVILQARPAAMRRTFTLREFARLGVDVGVGVSVPDAGSADVFRRQVAAVAGQRGLGEPPAPGADEIADPIGAALPVVRDSAQQVADAVDAIMRSLGLRS